MRLRHSQTAARRTLPISAPRRPSQLSRAEDGECDQYAPQAHGLKVKPKVEEATLRYAQPFRAKDKTNRRERRSNTEDAWHDQRCEAQIDREERDIEIQRDQPCRCARSSEQQRRFNLRQHSVHARLLQELERACE